MESIDLSPSLSQSDVQATTPHAPWSNAEESNLVMRVCNPPPKAIGFALQGWQER